MARVATRKRPFGPQPKAEARPRRPRVNIPLFAESLDLRQSTVPQPLELRAPVPSIAIGLVDWDAAATWRIEVEVSTGAGIRRLGTIITVAPGLAADPTRNRIVAVAYCPGALGWSLQIRPVAFGTTQQPATLSVMGTQCCAGPAGVSAIEPFATPLTPTTEGILIVQTFAAAANVNGGNGLIYVVEGQSFYLWTPGDPVTPDPYVHIAGVAGPVAGNWVHQGDDLFLTPLGGTPAADDWPRFTAVLNALATHGKRLVAYEGTFQAKSKQQIASGSRLLLSPDVTIRQTLPVDGMFDSASFVALNGLVVGAPTTITVAGTRGDKTITLAAALPAGSIILVNDATNGNRQSTHTIQSIVGLVVTLDRPLPRDYPVNSIISAVASVPTNIHLDGGGALMTGTGERFVEIAFGQNCTVENFRANNTFGIPVDLLFSFDVGGHKNLFRSIDVDCGPGAITLACIALESDDDSAIEDCNANSNGGNTGIVLYDCADCDVKSSKAVGAIGTGILFTSDFNVQNATTRGCIACRAIDCTALENSGGIRIDEGSIDVQIANCSADRNTVGIQIGDGLTITRNTELVNVTTRFNSQIGLDVSVTCPGTDIVDIDVTGNGTSASTGSGIVANDFVKIRGLKSDSGNNLNLVLLVLGSNVRDVEAAAAPTPAVIWCQLSGGAAVRHDWRDVRLTLAGGAANSACIQATATLSISGSVLASNGAAGGGIYVAPTGTVRLGADNNFTGCLLPTFVNVGGVFSQGVIVSGGAGAAQAVAFPDLTANDDVVVERTVNGGAPGIMPLIVKTPGVGFTLTFAAGDTSTYQWRIV